MLINFLLFENGDINLDEMVNSLSTQCGHFGGYSQGPPSLQVTVTSGASKGPGIEEHTSQLHFILYVGGKSWV